MVYTYNGILFSHEKEWSFDTSCSNSEPWKHYVKWNKPNIKGWILHDPTSVRYLRTGKFIETESRLEVARSKGEQGIGELLLNGYRVSLCGNEKNFGNK